MKITLNNTDNNYNAFIAEAYNKATFVSNEGEELSICMRDLGFEIIYLDSDDVEHHYSFNDGFVRRTAIKGKK